MALFPSGLQNIATVSVSAPQSVSQRALKPQLLLYVNNIFIPAWEIKVTLSAYGVADTVTATTFFSGLSDAMGGVSIAQMSQTVRPCPVVVKVVNHATGTGPLPVFQGFLDELDVDFDTDTMEIRCRGVLAVLIDQRMSAKAEQNTDVGAAIRSLITKYGLKAQVPNAGITVGNILTQDHVAHARNTRVFDFIRLMTNEIGWNIRVQGETVIVGPSPDRTQVPELVRTYGSDTKGFTSLKITHNALHSHDIKVKVLSYIPKTKGRAAATQQGAVAATLGLPIPVAAGKKLTSGGGNQSSGFTSVGESVDIQNEYVIHVIGKTSDQCLAIAAQIRDEISTKEFVVDGAWAPTDNELKVLANAGCEFTVRITGTADPVFNQSYFPREMHWAWGLESGLLVSLTANNLPLPNSETGDSAL